MCISEFYDKIGLSLGNVMSRIISSKFIKYFEKKNSFPLLNEDLIVEEEPHVTEEHKL